MEQKWQLRHVLKDLLREAEKARIGDFDVGVLRLK